MKVRFWIISSRGTDNSQIVELESLDYVKDKLEQWIEQFGCAHVSESCYRYGYEEGDEGCQNHVEWAIKQAARKNLSEFLVARQREVFETGKELKDARDRVEELEAARDFERM